MSQLVTMCRDLSTRTKMSLVAA